MIWGRGYVVGAWITGVCTFIVCWISVIGVFGIFLGGGLGWIPSAIIGIIAGLLWPVIVLFVLVGVIRILYVTSQGQHPAVSSSVLPIIIYKGTER